MSALLTLIKTLSTRTISQRMRSYFNCCVCLGFWGYRNAMQVRFALLCACTTRPFPDSSLQVCHVEILHVVTQQAQRTHLECSLMYTTSDGLPSRPQGLLKDHGSHHCQLLQLCRLRDLPANISTLLDSSQKKLPQLLVTNCILQELQRLGMTGIH